MVSMKSEPYKCLALDPPWNERGGGVSTRGAQRHYDLMSVDGIRHLLCSKLSSREFELFHTTPSIHVADSAHCWLWTTTNYLPDALGIMKAIGFRYVRSMVWVKMADKQPEALFKEGFPMSHDIACASLQIGLGQYLRGAHELCLFGVRGKAMVPDPENRLPDVIFAERTKHSRKPDAAFELFERVSPGPRLEMFAREARDGWSRWGAEAPPETAIA